MTRGFKDEDVTRVDLVDVRATLIRTTTGGERGSGGAFLIDDGTIRTYVPTNLVEHYPEDGIFSMPRWLAEDRGFA